MRAHGNVGAAVAARAGIELPDQHAVPLVIRTWVPSAEPAERHSPNCRSRCCGSWQPSLSTPASLRGGGGQAPAPSTPQRTPEVTPRAVVSTAPVPRPSRRVRPQGLTCAAGCGAPLDPDWAARTGQDRHGYCLGPGNRPLAAGSTGGAR